MSKRELPFKSLSFFIFLLLAACSGRNETRRSGAGQKADAYDFMVFASTYLGNYGIGGVMEEAVNRLQLRTEDSDYQNYQGYRGTVVRSKSADMERSLLYDMLSRNRVGVMFFLPENIFSFRGFTARYPEQKFVLPYNLNKNDDILPANLKIVRLRLEQGAFLAGIIAGMMTRKNRVGMLSDMSEKDTEILTYAFIQGVQQVSQESEILIVRTDSTESMLESETTHMISADDIDIIFAMSMNYNDTIIRSAYYLGDDVLLINSWYNADIDWPRHVIASLVVSFDPVIEYFMKHSGSIEDFHSLPVERVYDLSNEDVMRFSWDEQKEADTIFEKKRPKYSELSHQTRKETYKWVQRIQNKEFKVLNILEHSMPPPELQRFRFRDSKIELSARAAR